VPANRIVLGKHSGRHALHKRYEDLGIHPDAAQLADLYRRFVQLADRKKIVVDEDLMRLLQQMEQPISTTA
jgi:2-isopropylmalate synthase